MVWPGGMTCIWYDLAGMAWYMVWSSGHGMVYVVVWQAWYCILYDLVVIALYMYWPSDVWHAMLLSEEV